MMKRTLAVALSAAFFATATAAMIVGPIEHAAAAAKETSQDKSGMSFNDRRKKCSAEWKEAKAAGKTSNWKWPKFWSDCNTRLKTKGA
jgi:hypothetical protein